MIVRVSALAAFIFLVIFVLPGIKSFSAWPQVIELWQGGGGLESLIGHPHFFRFLVAYPGLALEARYPEIGFSIYCSIFFVINARMWAEIVWKTSFLRPSLTCWCIFFAAHLLMNGRGVIAWSAWLICISICIDLSKGQREGIWFFIKMFSCCLLATVSTGVFVVVLFSVSVFLIIGWRNSRDVFFNAKTGFLCLILIPVFCMFVDYFVLAVNKNLNFYGGGFQGLFKMLDHGVGRFFLSVDFLPPILFLLFFFFFFFLLVMTIFYFRLGFSPLRKLLFISFLGGLFGFTVLTLAIPLLLCEVEALKRAFFRSLSVRHALYGNRYG